MPASRLALLRRSVLASTYSTNELRRAPWPWQTSSTSATASSSGTRSPLSSVSTWQKFVDANDPKPEQRVPKINADDVFLLGHGRPKAELFSLSVTGGPQTSASAAAAPSQQSSPRARARSSVTAAGVPLVLRIGR